MNPVLLYALCMVIGILLRSLEKRERRRKEDVDCLLCKKYASRIFENRSFFVIYDDYPLRHGHVLILPRRHIKELTELTPVEFCFLYGCIRKMVKHLKKDFGADGYNLGVNCGKAAGQTLEHLHIHLFPRHDGDVADPRGGIRKCIANPHTPYPES